MELQSITLMEAYIIENLRKHGISNEELININEEAIEQWRQLNDRFDYTILKRLAEQSGDQYSLIINEGYRVKFLTLNGLINLVHLKLGKERDVDFVVLEDGIRNLDVNDNEYKEIQKILSPNWKITETSDGLSIRSKF